MTVKKVKNKKYTNSSRNDYYEIEENENLKKANTARRPITNWKKAWSEHEDDIDDIDDFYR